MGTKDEDTTPDWNETDTELARRYEKRVKEGKESFEKIR